VNNFFCNISRLYNNNRRIKMFQVPEGRSEFQNLVGETFSAISEVDLRNGHTTIIGVVSPRTTLATASSDPPTANDAASNGHIERPNSSASSRSSGFHSAVEDGSCQPPVKLVQSSEIPRPFANRWRQI
jgi:hypothetical protein